MLRGGGGGGRTRQGGTCGPQTHTDTEREREKMMIIKGVNGKAQAQRDAHEQTNVEKKVERGHGERPPGPLEGGRLVLAVALRGLPLSRGLKAP